MSEPVAKDFDTADFYRAEDEFDGVTASRESELLWEAIADVFRELDEIYTKVCVYAYERVEQFDASRCGYIGAFAATLAIRREMEQFYGQEVPIDEFDSHVQKFTASMADSAALLVAGLDGQIPKARKVGYREFTRAEAAALIEPHDPVAAKSIVDGG